MVRLNIGVISKMICKYHVNLETGSEDAATAMPPIRTSTRKIKVSIL